MGPGRDLGLCHHHYHHTSANNNPLIAATISIGCMEYYEKYQTSTNHFNVKLNPVLFTFYIWLYDSDPEL